MKILSTIGKGFLVIKKFAVEQKDKALAALGLGLTTLGTSSAHAVDGVTFAEATGFAGSIPLMFFYTAVGIIVVALVAMWAVKAGVKLFSRG